MTTYNSIFINNKFEKGQGVVFKSLNPATEEILWEGKSADYSDVDRTVQAAREAALGWASLSLEKRKTYLSQFAEILKTQKDSLAECISQETGKPLWESLQEVGAMINKIPISFNAYEERCQHVHKEMGEAFRATRFKPHGVVGVLGPFNLPGHLPNGHIVPALLAGNTVVFKPSELTPLVGQFYTECWQKVDLPPGVLNMVQGGKETGIALTEHSDLDGLFFTGSAQTGQHIHQAFSGKPEKILALEMGGNNPLIVSHVNDIAAACYMTIQSAFITSGQRCVCARRLIIIENQHSDEFLETLIKASKNIKVGSYTDTPEPFMGPVISKEAAQNVMQWQDKLMQAGGTVLLKMENTDAKALLTPGIIDVTDVNKRKDMEIFGPLLQVIKVKNLDEAIAEANNTQYGLAAGILCYDKTEYEKFYTQSRAGIINWNRQTTGASSEAPFGGIGQSGNHQPSAYFAADYCAYPVASIESEHLAMPKVMAPGVKL